MKKVVVVVAARTVLVITMLLLTSCAGAVLPGPGLRSFPCPGDCTTKPDDPVPDCISKLGEENPDLTWDERFHICMERYGR